MTRSTGQYRITTIGNEEIKSFIPHALPPDNPPLVLGDSLDTALNSAMTALARLAVAADMVPNAAMFLYGFLRKEALITSQIEGTQATLEDVLASDAGQKAIRPDDVQEVANYVVALKYARSEVARKGGMPLSVRLLCSAHQKLMKGTRGSDKQPGAIRQSQNWIGGTRPGNARFVPPPPEEVRELLSSLEKWIHARDPLPPLVKVGLAHAQFETIHPFLDGNGRIGRLLIALLAEHWGLIKEPLLYVSVAFKRHREEYYRRLSAIRTEGDWEGWIEFFLECVREAADDGVTSAQEIFTLITRDRQKLTANRRTTVPAIRLFDLLPSQPIITLSSAVKLLKTTKPTATNALDVLLQAGILHETTGKLRDRIYSYQAYMKVLTRDTSQ